MKVLIVNIDSTIPNLALAKVEKYHRDLGDDIKWDFPIYREWADRIYVSCVFKENQMKCNYWYDKKTLIGGSGWDLSIKLSPEIEEVKPKINLGFTTRGCIRHCKFCIVPEKEGTIHPVGDLVDLWDGKAKKIIVMDNNIIALPDHFNLICKQARENKIQIDFNQGLDHRLLNQDVVDELKSIRHKEFRFAYDHPSYFPSVSKAIDLLEKNNIKWSTWYVLVGFNTSLDEDLSRLNYLRERNQRAFVQRYTRDRKYIQLARWANQHHMFAKMTYEQFIRI